MTELNFLISFLLKQPQLKEQEVEDTSDSYM